MRSGESEDQKSRYTSDNNAGKASDRHIPNRIENLAAKCEPFLRYGYQRREVTAPAVMRWAITSPAVMRWLLCHMLAARTVLILHILSRIIQI